MKRELFHACLVAENRALGALARRVDRQHGEFAAVAKHVEAEHVDRGTLARSGHTCDTHAARIAGIWQTLLDHLLRNGVVIGRKALYHCYGTSESGDVPFENTFDKFRCRR